MDFVDTAYIRNAASLVLDPPLDKPHDSYEPNPESMIKETICSILAVCKSGSQLVGMSVIDKIATLGSMAAIFTP